MVNKKGVKGGNPYVQRKGMKTRKKRRASETVIVKTIARTYGTWPSRLKLSGFSYLHNLGIKPVGLAQLARMTTATSPGVSYSSMQRSYDVKGHDK
jgi:hypothetical protein